MNFDYHKTITVYDVITDVKVHLRALSMLAVCFVLAACGDKPVKITQESFSIDSPYQSRLDSNSTVACESARRVLLGDGYVIDAFSKESIKGRKAYRIDGERSTFIEMNIVCVDEPDGSMVYANGLLSTYDVKWSSGSASVGVSAFGSLSLPFGQSADSMVKTSNETIRDREFYRRFFKAVNMVNVRINKARESAMQQAEESLPRQQKQGNSGQDEETHSVSRNNNETDSGATEALPPTPQVEPARTAEALDEAQPKQSESSKPAIPPSQPSGNEPVLLTPVAPVESAKPEEPTIPGPVVPQQPAASDSTSISPALESPPATTSVEE